MAEPTPRADSGPGHGGNKAVLTEAARLLGCATRDSPRSREMGALSFLVLTQRRMPVSPAGRIVRELTTSKDDRSSKEWSSRFVSHLRTWPSPGWSDPADPAVDKRVDRADDEIAAGVQEIMNVAQRKGLVAKVRDQSTLTTTSKGPSF